MENDDIIDSYDDMQECSKTIRDLIGTIHKEGYMDRDKWDHRWLDGTLLPMRRELIEAQRHLVKAIKLLAPDVAEAMSMYHDDWM